MAQFPLIFVGSAALDLAAVGLVLCAAGRRSSRRGDNPYVHLRHVVAAVCVAAIVFIGKLPVHAMLGVDGFGVIHLAYLDLAVGVPLIGAAGLLISLVCASRSRPAFFSRTVVALAALSLAVVPVAVWASYFEPYRLCLETAEVPILSTSLGGATVRIGVLADIQTDEITDYERSAVERLIALKPDVILLPGDFFQGSERELHAALASYRELLARLDAPGGVYAVPGNVDRIDTLHRLFDGTRVQLLDNATAAIRVNECELALVGIEFDYQSPGAQRAINHLIDQRDAADACILLAHTPDAALQLRSSDGIDLVIAGHTHGGQLQIPGIGPPLTASRVPRATAAGGLTRVNGVFTYVSRGVGHERGQAPPLRLFCPPEISLLTLTARD